MQTDFPLQKNLWDSQIYPRSEKQVIKQNKKSTDTAVHVKYIQYLNMSKLPSCSQSKTNSDQKQSSIREKAVTECRNFAEHRFNFSLYSSLLNHKLYYALLCSYMPGLCCYSGYSFIYISPHFPMYNHLILFKHLKQSVTTITMHTICIYKTQ